MASRRTDRPAGKVVRETKITSRKVEIEEQDPDAKPGMGMADAIALVTFVIMLGAILVTDYGLGHQFATGVFFKP
jgi:hypothetical protein